MNAPKGIVFVLLSAFISFPTLAADDEVREEYDVESPAQIEAARRHIEDLGFTGEEERHGFTAAERDQVLARYAHLDPKHEVSSELLEKAVLYFDANRARFTNQNYVTVVDFTPRSDKYRLFVVDLKTGRVEKYHTTHGLNSDRSPRDGFAESFGNVVNSGKSSLGPVRTAEVYYGKFKRAVRLDGLGTANSNLRRRAVVMHGWDRVHERNVIQGLSWGCITLDWNVRDGVLDKIKEGSLLYVGQTQTPPVSKKRR